MNDANTAQRVMTAQERYASLTPLRSQFVTRAENASALTIPALFPPEGNSGSNLPKTYQSVGARGVNNLANRLIVALFPPGHAFFRLTLDDYVIRELAQQMGDEGMQDAVAEMESALSRVEKAVLNRMESKGARTTKLVACLHLIVTGNGLLQVLKDGSLRFHTLHNYVVKRDKSGNVVDMVVLEKVSKMTLPPEAQAIVDRSDDADPADKSGENSIEIYTRVQLLDRTWHVFQEVSGEEIPGTRGTYPLDKCAFIPLRWEECPGEDYGRGFIENYVGDLDTLDSLMQSIVELAAASARILLFVDEAGVTDRAQVANADSGTVLEGRAKDVTAFQLEKFADLRVAYEVTQGIEKRLEQAFMLLSGMQRHAERVTAEEIRQIAQELEQSLGGVYAILSRELQAPLVRRVMHQMQQSKDIPSLPEGTVEPKIITGMEALGRTSDLMKLDNFVAGIAQLIGPEAVATYINVPSLLKRRAAALSVDIEGLVKTPEEIQAEQQSAMERQMVQSMAPEAMRQQPQ
jgi:hypothetical protein